MICCILLDDHILAFFKIGYVYGVWCCNYWMNMNNWILRMLNGWVSSLQDIISGVWLCGSINCMAEYNAIAFFKVFFCGERLCKFMMAFCSRMLFFAGRFWFKIQRRFIVEFTLAKICSIFRNILRYIDEKHPITSFQRSGFFKGLFSIYFCKYVRWKNRNI